MSEILFYLIVFLTNIIQGITGFAGTVLAMPFSIRLVGYAVAKPVLNLLGLIAGAYVVIGGYKNVNRKQLKRVALFMAIGILFGILVKHVFAGYEKIMYILLGVFVIAIGLRGFLRFFLERRKKKNGLKTEEKPKLPQEAESLQEESLQKAKSLQKVDSPQAGGKLQAVSPMQGTKPMQVADKLKLSSGVLLLLAGIVHGIFVSGGPLIIGYLTDHTSSKEEFRRTVSAVWVILNGIVFFSDITSGYYTLNTIRIQAISIPFLFLGMLVGGWLFKRMNQKVFLLLTYFLLIVAGASLLMK